MHIKEFFLRGNILTSPKRLIGKLNNKKSDAISALLRTIMSREENAYRNNLGLKGLNWQIEYTTHGVSGNLRRNRSVEID